MTGASPTERPRPSTVYYFAACLVGFSVGVMLLSFPVFVVAARAGGRATP